MAILVGSIKFHSTLANGDDNALGFVHTYLAGTLTPVATYTDAGGLTANANPVALDVTGRASIWIDPQISYKFVSVDSALAAVPDGTVDNINAGTVPGEPFYTIRGDGTDQTAELVYAISLGLPVRIIGPALIIGTPTTITIPIVDTIEQIFAANAQVTIANGLPVRASWWGSAGGEITIAAASFAQPQGGVVLLENREYEPEGLAYNGAYFDVPNVTVRGALMPQLADDCKSLVGGTIVHGEFIAYANNIAFEEIGFDNGKTYVDGPGSTADGFVATYPSDALKTANALCRGLRLYNIIGLCDAPGSAVHGLIIGEGYSDVSCTGQIIGVYGLHGVVIKCAQVKCDQLSAYMNDGEGVIIKSAAQTTAISSDIQIDRIASYANGPVGWSPYTTATTGFGVFFHCEANNIGKVQIGQIDTGGHPIGLGTLFNGAYTIDSLQIDSIITDDNSSAGIYIDCSGNAGAIISRSSIGKAVLRNTGNGLACVWLNGFSSFRVGHLHTVNCSLVSVATGGVAAPMIGTHIAEDATNGVYNIQATSVPLVGEQFTAGATGVYYDSSGGGLVPALSGGAGWTAVAGGDIFTALPSNYGIRLQGLIKPGTSNTFATLPPFARPSAKKRFVCSANNAGAVTAVPVSVLTDGSIIVNEVAGGYANCTTWLSLDGIYYSLVY